MLGHHKLPAVLTAILLIGAFSDVVLLVRAAESAPRTILPGDRLKISVAEDEGLSGVYPVMGDGSIEFSYVGRLRVGGHSVDRIAEALAARLEKDLFKKATVQVAMSTFVEGSITIAGAVGTPGQIPYNSGTMITLLEAIVQVGGLAENSAGNEVQIHRLVGDGSLRREVITADVATMFEKGDLSRDQYLQPRDFIFVPDLGQGEKRKEYLVLGEIGMEGFHSWREGVDIIRAVTGAGGVSKDAQLDSVRLLRPNESGAYQAIPIDLSVLFAGGMQENKQVLPEDILYVPSKGNASAGQVYILGEVVRPGTAELPLNKSITLSRMILLRGGGTEGADLRKVRLIRTAPDGTRQELPYDIKRILDDGRFEDDIPLQDQDVIIVKRGWAS